MPESSRRRLLRKIGVAFTTGGLTGLAGCTDSVRVEFGEPDESTRTLRPTDRPTRTPTPRPTPTETDTMTATVADTDTPTETAGSGGLVARYPFDGTVRDATGESHLSGAEPAYVDGPEGSAAASWNGEFASSPELYAPTTDDALTFAFWLRDGDTASTWDDDLLWKLDSANREQIGAYCTTDGEVFVFTAGEGNDNNTMGLSDTSVLDGEWHHVAFVYDQPLDRMALYLDGEEEYDVEYTDDVPGMAEARLFFGNSNPDGRKGYDGGLDDFRYYNRALGSDEVSALYRVGDRARTATPTPTPTETPTRTSTSTASPSPTETPTPTSTDSGNVSAGLVARYRFEDDMDDAANGYDLSGTEPNYVDGPEGTTASAWSGNFASTGSGFYTPEADGALSACFWLRDTGTGSRWDDDLLWKITSEGGDQFGSFCDTDGEVFVFSSGNNTVGESDTSVLDGEWHHVAFVYEQSSDRMALYLDGEEEYDIEYVDDLTGMETTALFFGNNGSDGWKGYDGHLDDVRLYSRALTGDEISRIAGQ